MDSLTSTQITVLVLLVVWELVWKGLALWRAARLGQRAWFIAILIINSVGIVPIVYLIISRSKPQTTTITTKMFQGS